MPPTHIRAFRVRYYECDAYGHLNNANYARYMQEAAFDASSAVGYSMAQYEQLGHHWLVRATEIEYLTPVRYDDRVQVRTWVADIRRASSRRMYEFSIEGSPELAARGFSDWVYVHSSSGRPAAVPDDMARAFLPEREDMPVRSPFPPAPPIPPGVFRMRRRVAWQDIDSAGHANNAVYLNYIEECGFQAIAAHGWPVQRMMAEGFAILIRRNQVQYLQPALLDDELEIATWASDVRRSTATRHYTITRLADGALLAQAHNLGVWFDLKRQRPMRIPDHFIADFAPNLAESE